MVCAPMLAHMLWYGKMSLENGLRFRLQESCEPGTNKSNFEEKALISSLATDFWEHKF